MKIQLVYKNLCVLQELQLHWCEQFDRVQNVSLVVSYCNVLHWLCLNRLFISVAPTN